MKPEGKVRVIVRSRRAPSRIVEVSYPTFAPSGAFMGLVRDRRVVYDRVLDDQHRKAIEEGRRLSCNLGFELEVVDAGTRSFLGRLFSSLGSGSGSPSLIVSPPSQPSGSGLQVITRR